MKGSNIDPPFNHQFYYDAIKTINDIKFTPREIDVIACLLGGRGSKTIAHFLSIEEKTVETHKYNIMRKVECNSKECIINFVEKSGLSSLIRSHYQRLLLQFTFEQRLRKIEPLLDKNGASCLLIYWKENTEKTHLIYQMENQLKLTKIPLVIKESKQAISYLVSAQKSQPASHVICVLPISLMNQFNVQESREKLEFSQFIQEIYKYAKNISFVFLDREGVPIELKREFKDIVCIDFNEENGYYSSLFKVLNWLFPSKELEKLGNEFIDETENVWNAPETDSEQTTPKSLINFKSKEKSSFRALLPKKPGHVLLGFITVCVLSLIFLQWNKEDNHYLIDSTAGTQPLGETLPNKSIERIGLPQLIKEFNDEKNKNKNMIQACSFEMINDSSLWTNKKYSMASLEKNNHTFKESLSKIIYIENATRGLKKETQDNPRWFLWSNSNTQLKQIEELLRLIDKRKKYYEIHALLNESLFQIQKGNYDGQLLGNEGALLCVGKARTILEEYCDTHLDCNVSELQKDPINLDGKSEAILNDELLEIEYLLQKIVNLQGVIQKRQGANAKNDQELIEFINRALHSFKTICDWEKEEDDERKVNVLCNIAFIMYGWIGDFQAANQLLDDAYKLDSYNPCILFHRALCFKEIAQAKKHKTLPPNMEKALITDTRTWQGLNKSYEEYIKRAEFFSNSAVQIAEKNYLIRQVNSQIILLQNPKMNAGKAHKEFEAVDGYLKENVLEISGGFDEYYYYQKAKVFAALGNREEALKNLLAAKMYIENSTPSSNLNKHDVAPYSYINAIVDFVISDIRQPPSPTALPKCLEIDIDGPVIKVDKTFCLNPFRYALKFKPTSSKEGVKRASIHKETSQQENPKRGINSKDQAKKRIRALFKGMKEATSTDFVATKYYTIDQ